jgi:uncharacterized repeat protein (TIGR04052 family)
LTARIIAVAALLMLCASCSRWDLEVRIPFAATWQDDPIDCASGAPALTDLRLYVNNVQLIDTTGRAHDVRYATEFAWENDAVALIDLENGSGACTNGTEVTYGHIVGAIPSGEYRGLRFTVGVPFRLNHLNPLTAAPPLDDPDMHWHWRSGYKFLRAGIRTESDRFWIHVGSIGCEGTVGDITGCRYPNRIQVELPEFVPGQHGVRVDLAELLVGTNLADGVPSNCSSGPAEQSCTAPFAALGIDFETGEQTGAQRVFSVE